MRGRGKPSALNPGPLACATHNLNSHCRHLETMSSIISCIKCLFGNENICSVYIRRSEKAFQSGLDELRQGNTIQSFSFFKKMTLPPPQTSIRVLRFPALSGESVWNHLPLTQLFS